MEQPRYRRAQRYLLHRGDRTVGNPGDLAQHSEKSMLLHFIDNVAAQYSLVRGSSSITAGDVVVGETWRKVQALNTFFYVDRVESEANPADGLSRGKPDGSWQRVVRAKLPANLDNLLTAERESQAEW